MLSIDNVEFEYDPLEHASIVSRDAIAETLIARTNHYTNELNISNLERIVVKREDLFETELGLANYKIGTITLSRKIAVNLIDVNSSLYNKALSVFKHELYHFLDYQNLCANLLGDRRADIQKVIEGYKCWTEFYATYMTFDVLEDTDLYASFKYVFMDTKTKANDRKYYTSRLLGYYFQNGHSGECDRLVSKYLSRTLVGEIENQLRSMLKGYPHMSTEQYIKVLQLVEKAVIPEK